MVNKSNIIEWVLFTYKINKNSIHVIITTNSIFKILVKLIPTILYLQYYYINDEVYSHVIIISNIVYTYNSINE